jgi:hypothetical protein
MKKNIFFNFLLKNFRKKANLKFFVLNILMEKKKMMLNEFK